MARATILTIGNELVSGDVANSNAVFVAKRLAPLGVGVRMIAVVPDVIEEIAEFVRLEAPRSDFLIATGGLGGTPDDLTREAIAAAFHVPQVEVPDLAAELRRRFVQNPDYAARFAQLPEGSRPLVNPLGGAPGFAIENVYVLPGLPSEMEAMFLTLEDELRRGAPIGAWRGVYRTRESEIAAVLVEAEQRYPEVLFGSYPSFLAHGAEVELVAKSRDEDELARAVSWLERELQLRLNSAAEGR